MTTIDSIPLWVIGTAVVAALSIAIEFGYQLGSRVVIERGLSKHPVESAVCGSLLGLMAFMTAFTFGATVTRCTKIRSLVIDDANIAGSLALATDILPAAQRTRAKSLVREYVEIRSSAVHDKDPKKLAAAIARSAEIQQELWQIGNEVRRDSPDLSIRFYTSGVMKLIENDTARQTTAMYNRLPTIIWTILGFLALLATSVLGLSSGLHGRRSRLVATLFIVAYAFVFVLIVDLDRPIRSLFSQQDAAAAHVLEQMR